jgi:hypothetical protein
LKPFVVSRVNYTRFSKATSFDFDEALDKIIASAAKFNVERIKQKTSRNRAAARRTTSSRDPEWDTQQRAAPSCTGSRRPRSASLQVSISAGNSRVSGSTRAGCASASNN